MEPIDVPYVKLGKSIQSGDDLSTVDGMISNITSILDETETLFSQ
jgi:hypothetical protein